MALVYAVVADLDNVLSPDEQAELTDDTADGSVVAVTAILTASLESGESLIDSYIGTRYSLPLTLVPASIKRATLIIAKYRLMMKRNRLEEDVREEYMEVMSWLEGVRDGDMVLLDDVGVDLTAIGPVRVGFANVDTADFSESVFE